MVYLIALIAAIIGAWLNNRMTPTMRKSFLIALCVYVILVVGFRYKVGVDTLNYMYNYRFIPPLKELFLNRVNFRFEPGFLVICSICKSFYWDFWTVQMIMATITNTCIFLFIYKRTENPFWGVIFYFLLQCLYFNTEIMRESAAVGIFLLNYKNLEDKKWLPYYLLSCLSILFHYSAIVIWFFPFARWLKPNILFILLCVAFLAITPLVEQLNTLLNIAAVSGRIQQYVEGAEELNLNWRIAELVKSASPAIVALLGLKYCQRKVSYNYMLLLQILFCMGAFAIPIIFSRFTNYTTLFTTIALSQLICIPQVKIWFKSIVLVVVIASQSYYLYSMRDAWLPYVSIFYPENNRERTQKYRHVFFQWWKTR